MSKKSVLVLGATGLVGSQLIKKLELRHDVSSITVLTRRKVSFNGKKVRTHIVDFNNLDDLGENIFKVDTVFCAMGTTLKKAGSIKEQRRVDVDYQLSIAKNSKSAGVRSFVLISSSGADAKSKSPYLKMKGELEEMLQTLDFEKMTIIRPSLLIGKREELRIGESIGAFVLSVICLLPGFKRFKPISAKQVAKAAIYFGFSGKQGAHSYSLLDLFIE